MSGTAAATGFFDLAPYNGAGLADSRANDLLIYTTEPTQRIRIGCGQDTASCVVVGADGVAINAALQLQTLTLSNLAVSGAVDCAGLVASTVAPLGIKNSVGPLALESESRIELSVPRPINGALSLRIAGQERVHVAANGFVGINTRFPAEALDVAGGIALNGTTVLTAAGDATVASLQVQGVANLGDGLLRVDPDTRVATMPASSHLVLGPSSTLTVSGDATVLGDLTVGSAAKPADLKLNDTALVVDGARRRVGVGIAQPRDALDVVGTVRASVGSLGPVLLLLPPQGFTDVRHGERYCIDASLEPGNPAASGSATAPFFWNGFLGTDASGENAAWRRARFIVRGVLLTSPDGLVGNRYSTMAVHRKSIVDGSAYEAATPPFDLEHLGTHHGYRFFVTPWFEYKDDDAHYALYHQALDQEAPFRIGSLHVQFGA